ncbi:hypothetical protein [Ferrimonas lipolytica]|uniref:Lipoprotein n=1 Tax=Ferrimonas lipolytica TaxID=2724191 RepID=A0A6H1UGZ2_9GAMM|nr:hypothetical protein [Ferrimonas lipolytica]QIZ77899.1 hypothetical protein HER31_13945 [Ferrimonas lipolytica]
MRKWVMVSSALLISGCELTSPKPSATLAHFQVEQHSFHLVVGQQQQFGADTIKLKHQYQSDLDGDGQAERIGVITLNGGGSGTFYYLALSRWHQGSWFPAGNMLLGDRIKLDGVKLPQYGDVDAGSFYLSYWVHGPEQAMAEAPKFYLSKQFTMRDGELLYLEAN